MVSINIPGNKSNLIEKWDIPCYGITYMHMSMLVQFLDIVYTGLLSVVFN